MEAETFYFLISFWFDNKIVVKGKSGIYMGELYLLSLSLLLIN